MAEQMPMQQPAQPQEQQGGKSQVAELISGLSEGMTMLLQIVPPELKDKLAGVIEQFQGIFSGEGQQPASMGQASQMTAGNEKVRPAM